MPMKKELLSQLTVNPSYEVYNPIAFKDKDKYIFTLKQQKIWKRLLKKWDISLFDMVHAHTLFTDGNVAYRLYRQYNIPYIVTVRGHTDFDFFKKRPNLRLKGRKILKHASKIIFLSEQDKETLFSTYLPAKLSYLHEKAVVLPNGIDKWWFDHQGLPKQLANTTEMNFLFVGRVMKIKNLPITVEALNRLKEQGMQVTLTIVGPLTEPEIKKEIEQIQDFLVIFKGKQTKEELLKIYESSDLFIMPSIRETFGLVYAEAMSQGLPIIYSKNSGFYRQFLEGEIGYAVNPLDKEEIVQAIRKIADEYSVMSRNAVEKYKKFDWTAIGSQTSELYKEVVCQPRKINEENE